MTDLVALTRSILQLPPRYAVTQPRFTICGEDTAPRDGYRVYRCWRRGPDGSTAHDVWARDPISAARVVSPHIATVDVEEP